MAKREKSRNENKIMILTFLQKKERKKERKKESGIK